MTYSQIVNKINDVFNSCVNRDQMNTALDYCTLLIDRYRPSDMFFGTECMIGRQDLIDLAWERWMEPL